MSNRTEKTTITRAEYCQLHGLVLLAKGHYAALDSIEKAAVAITEEKSTLGGGHTVDAIGQNRGVDEMLELLGIKVEP